MTYPPGYPLASSGLARSGPHGGGSPPAAPTKEVPSCPARLTPRSLAAIEARLSARDREVMAAVNRFRVLSGAQLERLFWPEGSAATRARLARHGLSRLCGLGILAALERRIGGVRAGSQGRCLALGLAGQHLAAPLRRARYPHTPGDRYLAHTLAIGELYVELIDGQRWGACDSLVFQPEPSCWRRFPGPWGADLMLKPDAFVKLGVGEWAYSWLIERDMATESLPTVIRKAERHIDYYRSGVWHEHGGVAPRVGWIVPDESRAIALREALARLSTDEARRLFVTFPVADSLAALTSGAQS